MQFIQARNYTKVDQPGRHIGWLVIHDMESPEANDTAENVAHWFAGDNAPQASAHYCIDDNSVVQCVRDQDVAWAAPGANHNGLHFELAGKAGQTRAQWLDDYDKAELNIAARLVAAKCHQYNIPVRKITADDIKAGHAGICGHLDITNSGIGGSAGTHTDPGHNFPWDYFMSLVAHYANPPERTVVHNPYPGPDMSKTYVQGNRDAIGHAGSIHWIQWALGVSPDGVFGEVTFNATKVFQHAHNIDVDGKCYPGTLELLAKVTR